MQPCRVVLERLDTRPGAITKRPAVVVGPKRGRPGKPSQCGHCPAHFTSQSAALRHMETKHRDVLSRPTILGASERRQQPLKVSNAGNEMYENLQRGQHVAKMGQAVVCIYCNKLYSRKDPLDRHVRGVHSKIKIKCSFFHCGLYFLSQGDLDEHFRSQHQAQEDSKIFKCTECSYKASNKHTLDRHVKVRHGRRRLQCPKCTKIYRSEVALRIHLKRGHGKWLPCDHCGSVLMNINRHAQIKKCPMCDFVAACNTLMAEHVKKCKTAATYKSED